MIGEEIGVIILGATGAVGQRFLQQIENHSLFKVIGLAASQNSSGKKYGDVVHWLLPTPIPESVKSMVVMVCNDELYNSEQFKRCSVVFSALDSSVATEIENQCRDRGKAVFSNSKNHRYDTDVPICAPNVNPEHMDIVTMQESFRKSGGFIVTNPNCSTTGVVVVLKPLLEKYGLEEVVVFTMQSISGAGYPGVPSLDILGNVVPFISDEEEKIEIETKKILGSIGTNSSSITKFQPLDQLKISAHTNRVAVSEGHTICLSIKLKQQPSSIDDIKNTFESFNNNNKSSGSFIPIHIFDQDFKNRPQPKLDVEKGNGYTVSVGRIRGGACSSDSSFNLRLTLLVHNTVLGAAGGSILNAETCFKKGLIKNKN
eukprot:gene1984-2441_t